MEWTRRHFLADIGKGVLIATLGPRLTGQLGLGALILDDDALSFGPMEPLVCFVQETAPEKLLPLAVGKLRGGTSLRDLVAATALANARTFGGQDYVGYHALMALMPALQMASELPEQQRALPVLKVLYRNVQQIQKHGGRKGEVLRALPEGTASRPGAEALRESVRRRDLAGAERALLAQRSIGDALDPLLLALEDKSEVHRVVLTFRSYDLASVVGAANAHTLLRQAVRYYVQQEAAAPRPGAPRPAIDSVRTLVPELLDEHDLHDRKPGQTRADDAWVERMSRTVAESPSGEAAGAVAAAIAEGIALDSIHEAVALAANSLVLRDAGPLAHGATSGVHASDTVHAFHALARATAARHAIVCTILSAWHVCSERGDPPREKFLGEAHPKAKAAVRTADAQELLRELESAVRANDQTQACAVAARYGELGHADSPLLALLLRHAVSEDGKLHAEKYYRTVREELARARPAFRWRHVVGLARFLASAHGEAAPGYAEARSLLG